MKRKKSLKNKSNRILKYNIKHKEIKLLILFILLAVVICFSALGIWKVYINNKYSYYTDKMIWYGLDKLYDNESVKATEHVKKSEIAKLTVGTVLNKTDKNYAKDAIKESFGQDFTINTAWLKYAEYAGIYGIKDDELDNTATKIDAAIYIVQAVEIFAEEKIKVTETLDEKLIQSVNDNIEEYVNKAISIGILENTKTDIKDKKLIKGEFSKMLITVFEKYNIILYNRNYTKANLVLDKEKMPENYEIYPYIADNITNDIYEITTDRMNYSISRTPKDVYKIHNMGYENTEENVINYFNVILNIDYAKISTEDLINKINKYMVYNLNIELDTGYKYKDIINKYVNYVKENKIILKGSVTPLLPIIYSDGLIHYLRCKIKFEVVNSNTNENLLLWDKNTTYNSDNIEIYVDVPVSPTYYSLAFRIFNDSSLGEYIVKNDGNVEVKE